MNILKISILALGTSLCGLAQADMIGVKGRLQNRIIEMPDGNKKRKTEVIAEKITFLSSSQRKADNSERETKITEEKRKADE